METTKIIFLWAHVRSVSTAFERAFMQREDYVSFHEPFSEPCYYGPERIYNYYNNELTAHAEHIDTTYSQVIKQILETATNKEKKNVFVKDMARHVVRPGYKSHRENPTMLPIDFLKRCKHTFIIRTPEKSVLSLYRGYLETKLEYLLDEIGYPELQALFEFLTELTGARPAVVEADELLAEPSALMRMYCESAICDRFEPCMLKWRAGQVKAFDKWRGAHDNAEWSTGFNQIQTTKDNTDDTILPDDIQQMIEQNMPIYQTLSEFRIRV